MNFNRVKLKGLTLVELLVVLGIIVVLVGLSVVVINPNKQRDRSRDAVLSNTIGSIGQAIDTFYGLQGYYPIPSQSAQVTKLQQFIGPGFTYPSGSTSTSLLIQNSSVFAGRVAGGTLTYYSNDFIAGGSQDLPCVEAASNEFPTTHFLAWAPGFPVKLIATSCRLQAGYLELTGLSPL